MSKRIEFNTVDRTSKTDSTPKITKVKGYISEIDGIKFGLHYGQNNPQLWTTTNLETGGAMFKSSSKQEAITFGIKNMKMQSAEQAISNFKKHCSNLKFPVNEST